MKTGDLASEFESPPPSLDAWPEPRPLPAELPPVAAFDYALLPEVFRPWVQDIAERIQCPPDFPAISAMIAAAGVVGRKIGIRPKRYDDWLVVPNLWGVAIGPPSVKKSAAVDEPLRPLEVLEARARERHEEELREYEAEKLVAEQRRQLAKTTIKQSLEEQNEAGAKDAAHGALAAEPEPPVRRRYIVIDTTVEKLGELLSRSDNGLTQRRDEISGFLKSLEKDGQETARAFYLEAWTGTGRFTYDRIGRGNIEIEAATISLIGTIQPGPLGAYVRAAIDGGNGADGFIQRFQLAVYPDIAREWRNVDRWPDSDVRRRAHDAVFRLDTIDAASVGAEVDTYAPNGVPFLRFDADAQALFDGWLAELERRLRAGDEHAAMEAHLAKYRSLMPSLALLGHLIDGHTGPVRAEYARRAIAWCAYLETHARRIYAVAVTPDVSEGRALAAKVLARQLGDEFALRDVYRSSWIGLTTKEAAARAVDLLVDLDWLVEAEEATAGRPRRRYRINPRVFTECQA